MPVSRADFEKLLEIAEHLEGAVWSDATQRYVSKYVNHYRSATFLNGAWYAWQEQQKRIDELNTNKRELTKDENGNCLHFHHEFGHKRCFDCGASLEGWQPDWSQAPNADAWRMYGDGNCAWLIDLGNEDFKWFGRAPSFNYQGDWKDSLRKRPSND